MFHLIGQVIEFAVSMIGMVLDLAFGALSLVFSILGGIFSFFLSLGVLGIVVALIFIVRRGKKKKAEEPRQSQRMYDVDGEEFTSFYDQFRE